METSTVSLECPECQRPNTVSQVQGDHCPGCGFEFKWFQPDELRTAQDYMEILTGRKHLVTLAAGGYIIAHE